MKRREFLKFLGAGAAVVAVPELAAKPEFVPETRNPAEVMRDILIDQGADIDHGSFDKASLWLDSPVTYGDIAVGDIINIKGETMRVTESVTSDAKGFCYSVVKYNADAYKF